MTPSKLKPGSRLDRFLTLLSDREWHHTAEIVRKAKVCAVNSCASDARLLGRNVQCQRRRVNGYWVYFYRLARGRAGK